MSHALQSRAAARILELFVVSPEEAQVEAAGLLGNIEAHCGDPDSWGAVEDRIERHLGARLSWRRQTDKDAAAQRRSDSIAGYTAYLDSRRKGRLPK